MRIGTHVDGRPLEYDGEGHLPTVDGSAVTFEQLRQYEIDGQISWVSPRWQSFCLADPTEPFGRPGSNDGSPVVSPESTSVSIRRIGAFLVDIFLINVVQEVLTFLAVFNSVSSAEFDATSKALGILLGCSYFVVLEAAWGRTLGKSLFHLRVVNLSGDRITLLQSLGRNAARSVDMILFALPALLSMSGSPLHQRLGDKWAKTAVVRIATVATDPEDLTAGIGQSKRRSRTVVLAVLGVAVLLAAIGLGLYAEFRRIEWRDQVNEYTVKMNEIGDEALVEKQAILDYSEIKEPTAAQTLAATRAAEAIERLYQEHGGLNPPKGLEEFDASRSRIMWLDADAARTLIEYKRTYDRATGERVVSLLHEVDHATDTANGELESFQADFADRLR